MFYDFLFPDDVDPNVAMVIVNALYFRGEWTLVFEDAEEPVAFTLTNGERTLVNMMQRSSQDFAVAKFREHDIDFTALAIPYVFQQGRFEMIIIMPDRPRGLEFLINTLERKKGDSSQDNFFDSVIFHLDENRYSGDTWDVTMPKFKIDSGVVPMNAFLQNVSLSKKKSVKLIRNDFLSISAGNQTGI